MTGLLLAERTRAECRTLATAGAVVVLPVGATEQHGPHLPIGTDTLHVEHVARAAAARLQEHVAAPILVAPTLPFGCSPHHLPFGGTISLPSETFLRLLLDIGGSLATSGFRRLFLLNGHGGNHQLTQVAARDLALAHPVDVAACSWWDLATEAFVAAGALDRGRVPGHAGSFETAIVAALRPDLVVDPPSRPDASPGVVAFRDPLAIEKHDAWGAIDGWSDSPALGDARDGAAYLEAGIDAVAVALERFVRATGEVS